MWPGLDLLTMEHVPVPKWVYSAALSYMGSPHGSTPVCSGMSSLAFILIAMYSYVHRKNVL